MEHLNSLSIHEAQYRTLSIICGTVGITDHYRAIDKGKVNIAMTTAVNALPSSRLQEDPHIQGPMGRSTSRPAPVYFIVGSCYSDNSLAI